MPQMTAQAKVLEREEIVLILSRKVGEQICIAKDIVVVVRQIKGDRVSVGIEAPKAIRVARGELQDGPPPTRRVSHPVCNP
jgi:carbon storage regulator